MSVTASTAIIPYVPHPLPPEQSPAVKTRPYVFYIRAYANPNPDLKTDTNYFGMNYEIHATSLNHAYERILSDFCKGLQAKFLLVRGGEKIT